MKDRKYNRSIDKNALKSSGSKVSQKNIKSKSVNRKKLEEYAGMEWDVKGLDWFSSLGKLKFELIRAKHSHTILVKNSGNRIIEHEVVRGWFKKSNMEKIIIALYNKHSAILGIFEDIETRRNK